jgi:hypothetical protein
LQFWGFPLSTSTGDWSNFGSYIGGVAGPILSFITLFFVLKTLKLQNEANRALKDQLDDARRTEKIGAFSDLFFDLIASQRTLFEKFELTFFIKGAEVTKQGVDAIMEVEDEIAILRAYHATDEVIEIYLDNIDLQFQIFGIMRAFYISVKMIIEKLSDKKGFSEVERLDFFNTLINFTDFAQLRLISIGMQFNIGKPAEYLNGQAEFVAVMDSVGLKLNSY